MGLLNLGFIGLGNYGGQIANAAVQADIQSIALNASVKDLNVLDKQVTPFLIGDGKGTGKSREQAKQFLLDHISIIEDDTFAAFISEHDVIVIAGSAGGGFGSGATPALVNILTQSYPNKCFITLTTFPSVNETYTAQNHTEQFMREILEMNIPYIIYDNDVFNNLEASDMNQKIIDNAISDMKILRGDYAINASTGGIDERDLMTVLSTPGRLVCTAILDLNESMIINDSIVETLKASLGNTGNAQIVADKVISASATMYNLTDDLKKYAPNIISDIQTTFGEHIGDYRNEVMDNQDMSPFAVCILAGLTEPTTRIDKVIARRLDIEKEIANRKSASTKLNNVQEGGLKLGAKSFGNKTQKPNIDEIIKRFAASGEHNDAK